MLALPTYTQTPSLANHHQSQQQVDQEHLPDLRLLSAGLDGRVLRWDPYDMGVLGDSGTGDSEMTAMTFHPGWGITITGVCVGGGGGGASATQARRGIEKGLASSAVGPGPQFIQCYPYRVITGHVHTRPVPTEENY
jgi:hypothetical protein